jgi:hypothetical protein
MVFDVDVFCNLRDGAFPQNRRSRSCVTGGLTMTKIDEASVLAISGNASFQSLGEGAVVLLIDSGQLYTCNEATEAFLELIDGTRPFGAIVDALLREFDIERATATVDFREIAEQLQSEGIVEVKKTP